MNAPAVEDSDSDHAAREVWLLISDLVLDNQRRREVSDALGISFGRARTVRRLARKPMSMSELAAGAGHRSSQRDRGRRRPRSAEARPPPAASHRPAGQARRGDAQGQGHGATRRRDPRHAAAGAQRPGRRRPRGAPTDTRARQRAEVAAQARRRSVMPSSTWATVSHASTAASSDSKMSFQRITTIGSMPPANSEATPSRCSRSPSFSRRWISTRCGRELGAGAQAAQRLRDLLAGADEHVGELDGLLHRRLDPVEAELVGGLLGVVDDVVERRRQRVAVAGVERRARCRRRPLRRWMMSWVMRSPSCSQSTQVARERRRARGSRRAGRAAAAPSAATLRPDSSRSIENLGVGPARRSRAIATQPSPPSEHASRRVHGSFTARFTAG